MNIIMNVRFEVFVAVTMKNAVFWDLTRCGSCKNLHSEKRITYNKRVDGISKVGTLAVTNN
jgi:hypothetical protein